MKYKNTITFRKGKLHRGMAEGIQIWFLCIDGKRINETLNSCH